MQVPVTKIVRLLHPDQAPEVRAAAVVVLAELGVKDGGANGSLVDLLKDPDRALRLAALRAAGKLKLDAALPLLLDRIKDGGEEAEQAAQAAARLGAKGT